MNMKTGKKILYGLGAMVILFFIFRAYKGETERISKEKAHNAESYIKEVDPRVTRYEVLEINPNNKFKAIVQVRIFEKLSNEEISLLAHEVKDKYALIADKIHIFLLLPEMMVGNGAWAVADFDPNYSLTILGQSLQDDKIIESNSSNLDEYLGLWTDDQVKGDLAYGMRKDKKLGLVIEIISVSDPGPSALAEPLKKTKWKGKTKYIKRDNEFGEYYLLESNGNLSIYDVQGYIATYKKRK